MFDNEGLVKGFKVNRTLTEDELRHQLKPAVQVKERSIHQCCLIKVNSTFLESVDKYFFGRGELTFMLGGSALMCVGAWAIITFSLFFLWDGVYTSKETLFVFCMVSVLTLPMAVLCIRSALKETFRYTHYPIRLNRKNRLVYVFRLDGSVLEAKWDDLFFHLGRSGPRFLGIQSWDIRAHVMGEDGWEVLETFAFSMHDSEHGTLLGHWEYLRRYMEEGPDPLVDPEVTLCHNVDVEREGFERGLHSLLFNLHGALKTQLFLLPIWYFPSAIGRWFAVHTSKIPEWPEWVEQACAIDPEDPFQFDGRSHPLKPNYALEFITLGSSARYARSRRK